MPSARHFSGANETRIEIYMYRRPSTNHLSSKCLLWRELWDSPARLLCLLAKGGDKTNIFPVQSRAAVGGAHVFTMCHFAALVALNQKRAARRRLHGSSKNWINKINSFLYSCKAQTKCKRTQCKQMETKGTLCRHFATLGHVIFAFVGKWSFQLFACTRTFITHYSSQIPRHTHTQ